MSLSGCEALPGHGSGMVFGDTDEATEIEGVVRHLQVEGGVWVIEDADGTTYNPINLPKSYQKRGLLVRVQAVAREDMASIHQVGPIIEIRAIEKR